jgi:hypothetical protein
MDKYTYFFLTVSLALLSIFVHSVYKDKEFEKETLSLNAPEFCEAKRIISSVLDSFQSQYEANRLGLLSRARLPHDIDTNPQELYDGILFKVIEGEFESDSAFESAAMVLVDDEIRVILNEEMIFEQIGVRGAMEFPLTLKFKKGMNKIVMYYSNLGGLGRLLFKSVYPTGASIPWVCEGDAGFCESTKKVTSSFSLGAIDDGFVDSSKVMEPVFQSFSEAVDGRRFVGTFENESETKVTSLLNIVYDDEIIVFLNDKVVNREQGGARAPAGDSIPMVLEPGVNTLKIYYQNILGDGYLRFGTFFGNRTKIPWRCGEG